MSDFIQDKFVEALFFFRFSSIDGVALAKFR